MLFCLAFADGWASPGQPMGPCSRVAMYLCEGANASGIRRVSSKIPHSFDGSVIGWV